MLLTDDLPFGFTPGTITAEPGHVRRGGRAGHLRARHDRSGRRGGGHDRRARRRTAGAIQNTASVEADQVDPDEGDNFASVTTDVRRRHDLTVTKTDDADPVAVGADVTYTVTVRNVGAEPGDRRRRDRHAADRHVVRLGAGLHGGRADGDVRARDARARTRRRVRTIVARADTPLLKTNTVVVTANEADDFPSDNTATQTTRVRDSALDLARAMIEDESWLTGASFVTVPPRATRTWSAASPLAGFPRHGDTFALLTSGDAELADDPNTSDELGRQTLAERTFAATPTSTSPSSRSTSPSRPGSTASRSTSASAPRSIPSTRARQYNDAFIAELDASTWTTAGSAITAADNFAFDPSGNPITINAAGFTSMTEAHAAGTTYDGATPLLSASSRSRPARTPSTSRSSTRATRSMTRPSSSTGSA